MPRQLSLYLCALVMGILADCGLAGDWPRWRGSLDGNGVADASGLPDTFDQTSGKDSDAAQLKNVRWVVRLGCCTYGSPVVANGKVYVGGATDFRECAVLWCFRESDGKMLWRMRSPTWPKVVNRTWGICATPTVDGERVYLLGHQGEVFCLDANGLAGRPPSQADLALIATGRKTTTSEIAPDGRRIIELSPGTPGVPEPTDAHIVWQYDLIRELKCWPYNAQSGAVLIRGDRAYVATGSVISGYGKDGSKHWLDKWKAKYGKSTYESPSLIVLDKNTGKLLATEKEGMFERTFHGAHSSPIMGTVNGKELLFYGGGDGTCYAFDPDFSPGEGGGPGTLKLVWKYNCVSPATYDPNYKGTKLKQAEVLGTPVFHNNRVYVSIGNDLGDGRTDPGTGRLLCLDATKAGDVTATAKVWSLDDIGNTGSTVAIADGLLYTADAAGNVYCLDAGTGETCWTHQTSRVWTSPVIADGKVYVVASTEMLVFAAAREKKLVARTKLRDNVVASPAVANGALYVATDKFLYALEQGRTGRLDTTLSPWTAPEAAGVRRPEKPARWPWVAGAGGVAVLVVAAWAARRRKRAA